MRFANSGVRGKSHTCLDDSTMTDERESCVSLYVAIAVVFVTGILLFLRRSRKRNEEPHPPDTVMLHQFGKGVHAPSISPFALKLETYLRMADIPYKNLYDRKMSSKGKIPWIEYNDETVPDSTFCVDYLSTKFNVNLGVKYSKAEKAIARAFVKMLEENTFWYIGLSRCVYDKNSTIFRKLGLGWLIRKILQRKATSSAWSHGIGRHSQTEVEQIALKDLEAMANFLGDKKFLLGDSPCVEDCAVFGQLAQFVWQMPGTEGEKAIHEKFPKLKQYCIRMKEKYWPDWNEMVLESI